MSPERAAALVARWVRLYTGGLPASVADRRIEEIDADLHEHVEHERSLGTAPARISSGILWRMVRGAADDVAWRGSEARAARVRSTKERAVSGSIPTRSAFRVTVGVLAVLSIPLIGSMLSDEFAWSVADFVLAGVLLGIIGVMFELAIRRRGGLLVGGGVAVLGVAAVIVGELDDAPGLVLLGGLLVAGGVAVVFRRVQRPG